MADLNTQARCSPAFLDEALSVPYRIVPSVLVRGGGKGEALHLSSPAALGSEHPGAWACPDGALAHHRCLPMLGRTSAVGPARLPIPYPVGLCRAHKHPPLLVRILTRRDCCVQAERGEGWSAGMRILLGGTGVLNSRSFMNDLMAFMALQ